MPFTLYYLQCTRVLLKCKDILFMNSTIPALTIVSATMTGQWKDILFVNSPIFELITVTANMTGQLRACVEITIIFRYHINIMEDETIKLVKLPCFFKAYVHHHSFVKYIWGCLQNVRTHRIKINKENLMKEEYNLNGTNMDIIKLKSQNLLS